MARPPPESHVTERLSVRQNVAFPCTGRCTRAGISSWGQILLGRSWLTQPRELQSAAVTTPRIDP
eukprot:scaffold1439_cov404-Prasinococcus_capsulatus_cf.AAC.62